MHVVDIEAEFAAPAERAFAVLTDHESMWRWTPGVRRVELDPVGQPDRNGIGAVRNIHTALFSLQEEVVGWLPPRWYEYRVTGGVPIRDHLGRVEVTALGEGRCKVRWRVEFRAMPGMGLVTRVALKAALKTMLSKAGAIIEHPA